MYQLYRNTIYKLKFLKGIRQYIFLLFHLEELLKLYVNKFYQICITLLLGHSRIHPYHPHGGNRKLTPLPPSDILIHLLLSETIFSPPPDGRNFLRGGSMDLFWNNPFLEIFEQKKITNQRASRHLGFWRICM